MVCKSQRPHELQRCGTKRRSQIGNYTENESAKNALWKTHQPVYDSTVSNLCVGFLQFRNFHTCHNVICLGCNWFYTDYANCKRIVNDFALRAFDIGFYCFFVVFRSVDGVKHRVRVVASFLNVNIIQLFLIWLRRKRFLQGSINNWNHSKTPNNFKFYLRPFYKPFCTQRIKSFAS